jgi:hypothetical protein
MMKLMHLKRELKVYKDKSISRGCKNIKPKMHLKRELKAWNQTPKAPDDWRPLNFGDASKKRIESQPAGGFNVLADILRPMHLKRELKVRPLKPWGHRMLIHPMHLKRELKDEDSLEKVGLSAR